MTDAPDPSLSAVFAELSRRFGVRPPDRPDQPPADPRVAAEREALARHEARAAAWERARAERVREPLPFAWGPLRFKAVGGRES